MANLNRQSSAAAKRPLKIIDACLCTHLIEQIRRNDEEPTLFRRAASARF